MEPIFNFLLLSVLFVAGFINFLLYFPTKRFTAWFQSIKPSSQTPYFKSTPLQPPPRPSPPPPPPPSAMELKKVFGTFDKNNDGFITQKELMESLKSMRMMITEKDAEEMLKGVDENGDGLIDFEEFCVLGKKLMMGFEENKKTTSVEDDEDELKDAFGVFDKDSDGLISVEELSLVLCSLGMNEGKIVENCKEMIRKVDLDGDGMVNFDEFKKMMRNGVSVLT